MVPSLLNLPQGCAFQNRCKKVLGKCRNGQPDAVLLEDGRIVRCFDAVRISFMKPLLKVSDLSKEFVKSLDLVAKFLNKIGQDYREEIVHAVDNVSFEVFKVKLLVLLVSPDVASQLLVAWFQEYWINSREG